MAMKACSRLSSAAMRASVASATWTGLTAPERISAPSAAMVMNSGAIVATDLFPQRTP